MAQKQVQPAPSNTEGDDIAQWRSMLDKHGAEHGFHIPLGGSHGVLYTADERTLIVSFENAEHMRGSETGLPLGLQVAGREGWSNLALYSEGKTWFRDPAVYNLFDTLTDEQFFEDFDRVLFCGAGAGGYAGVLSVVPEHSTARLLPYTSRHGGSWPLSAAQRCRCGSRCAPGLIPAPVVVVAPRGPRHAACHSVVLPGA